MQSLFNFLKTKTEYFLCYAHYTSNTTSHTSQTGEKLSADWHWFVANISENTDVTYISAHHLLYQLNAHY